MADDDNPLSMCKGPTGFIFIFLGALLVFIMFDKSIGNALIEMVNVVFFPAFGFGGQYPIMTLLILGFIMIVISTVARHFMINWKQMAKDQKMLSAYQKEVNKATKENNQAKMKKLQEMNTEVLKLQQKQMFLQMKPMIVTMFAAIIIFRWLYHYMSIIPQEAISMPWDETWPLRETLFGQLCCFGGSGGIPYWVAIYTLVSVPVGQVLMRGLKLWDFQRDLKKLEVKKGDELQVGIKEVQGLMDEAAKKKVDVSKAKANLRQAESFYKKSEYAKSSEFLKNARGSLDSAMETHERTQSVLEEVESQYKEMTAKGIKDDKAKASLDAAKVAWKKNDLEAVLGSAKKAEEEIKQAKKEYKDTSGVIEKLKSMLYDIREYDDGTCSELLEQAKKAQEHSNFSEVAEVAKAIKKEAQRLEHECNDAKGAIRRAERLVKEKDISDKVPEAVRLLEQAKAEMDKKKFISAKEKANNVIETINTKL